MKAPLTYGLTHIALAVKSVERTLHFYQSIFNMQVMYHTKEMIQLSTPGCKDILVFEQGDERTIGRTGGIAHFGFRLKRPSDMEGIYEKILALKATVIDKGAFVPGSPYVFFKDPDGYIIEVWYEKLP